MFKYCQFCYISRKFYSHTIWDFRISFSFLLTL